MTASNTTGADDPVIIEVALNGATSKRRNPNVPVSVDELVADAIACIDEGAAIVHQHDAEGAVSAARTAEQSIAVYERVLAARPDALLYPTATFLDPITERWGHHLMIAETGLLKMAYLDTGSVNLGRTALAPRGPSDFVYTNSMADIDWKMQRCEELRLGPSMAMFEPGFVRVARAYEDAGRLPAGAFAKFYFGGGDAYLFGFTPTELALDAYLSMMDGSSIPWAVAVLGGDVVATGMARFALERGGHLRTGLEDHSGPDTPTNVELVAAAVAAVESSGRRVATPAEAAELLALPRR